MGISHFLVLSMSHFLIFSLSHFQHLLVGSQVHAVDGGRCSGIAVHDEQQFLTFASHAHHVHLPDVVQLSQGFRDVKHGRQLQHHPTAIGQQLVLHVQHVRSAVGDAHRLAPYPIATGRVNVYELKVV